MSVDDGVLTFHDMLDYITALTDGGARTKDLRLHKEAILGAYRDITMCHEWDYYMKEGRVNLSVKYTTGTITYDHTGADYERRLHLAGAGASWPDWAGSGRVRISDVVSSVDRRISGAYLTLDENLNPGADIAAGTSFELYQTAYALPADLWRLYDVAVEKSYWTPNYITPSEWLGRERFHDIEGQTWAWTIMKDPDNDNRFAMFVDPKPNTAEPLGFIYRRRPRTLRWAGTESTARATTITGVLDATSVTASATLPQNMVGSIIRLTDSGSIPTGLAGTNPYIEQHRVVRITGTGSSTIVDIAGTVSQAYTAGSKAQISDPIDMNDTMLEAFKAQVEYRLSRFANDLQDMTASKGVAEMELRRSLEAESRVASFGGSGQSRYDYLFSHLQNTITTDA
jgi:hypothetical protein